MSEKLGILGRKLGMTRIFDENGAAVPVTLVQAGPCPIIQVKEESKDGYNAIQIGFGAIKVKNVTKALQGHIKKANAELCRTLREIRLESSAEFEAGQDLTVDMFESGEFVKVVGRSIGKGFQGVMKRWNFAGAPDSHGAEKVHRSMGSTGCHTFPGRVFKNKKMPGHMGDERVTVFNLEVMDVRPEDNLLVLKGSIPGPRNGLVMIRKQ